MDHHKSLGMLMGQLMRAKHNRMAQLIGSKGVHPGQAQLLLFLNKNEGLTQKELGEKVDLKPATITIMLNRMEKAGLAERRPDKEDLRISRVYMTEKGRQTEHGLTAAVDKVQQEAYHGFSEEELMLMRRFLLHMKYNLDEAMKSPGKKVSQ